MGLKWGIGVVDAVVQRVRHELWLEALCLGLLGVGEKGVEGVCWVFSLCSGSEFM